MIAVPALVIAGIMGRGPQTSPLALLGSYCLESVFGDAIEADDLELSGTTLQLATEIPHTDVAETLTADWSLKSLKLTLLTSEPSEVAGQWYYADNDTWDPCNIAGTDNYYVICKTVGSPGTFIAIVDENGKFFISSIELPSFTHWATGDATYNDTSTPHVLTSEECKNGIITNCGATEDRVYTCPAAEFGMNFMVMVIEAFQMDLEPDGSETLWLNGTQMAAGEHIQNAADTKGDVMSCWSIESGDGTYEIFCKSDNVNWAQATP
ncbi:hypothetical protein KAU19_08425 [Candidatus Parcubacteria bacterium]|nr:hypothetical protein [Candidatus Parcubacteria bacterium]